MKLYVFDEHNEAFFYWKLAMDHTEENQLDLLHIDAHSDMHEPKTLSGSIYCRNCWNKNRIMEHYWRICTKDLFIDDFILPSILTGTVRDVYFIFPPWRNLKPFQQMECVGSIFGNGRVIKRVQKRPRCTRLETTIFPDLTCFTYRVLPLEQIPSDRDVVLDIDLDYFACRDSVCNDAELRLEITEAQFNNRRKIPNSQSLAYKGLRIDFSSDAGKYYCDVALRKVAERVHIPSRSVVEEKIEEMAGILKEKNVCPKVVSICRSNISGYCPLPLSEFIESRLRKALRFLAR